MYKTTAGISWFYVAVVVGLVGLAIFVLLKDILLTTSPDELAYKMRTSEIKQEVAALNVKNNAAYEVRKHQLTDFSTGQEYTVWATDEDAMKQQEHLRALTLRRFDRRRVLDAEQRKLDRENQLEQDQIDTLQNNRASLQAIMHEGQIGMDISREAQLTIHKNVADHQVAIIKTETERQEAQLQSALQCKLNKYENENK